MRPRWGRRRYLVELWLQTFDPAGVNSLELIKLMNILIIQFDRNLRPTMMHNNPQSYYHGSAKSPHWWGFGGKRSALSPHLKPSKPKPHRVGCGGPRDRRASEGVNEKAIVNPVKQPRPPGGDVCGANCRTCRSCNRKPKGSKPCLFAWISMAFSEREAASIAQRVWSFAPSKDIKQWCPNEHTTATPLHGSRNRFSSNNLPGVYPSEIILPRKR
jgi:hypothetical protein